MQNFRPSLLLWPLEPVACSCWGWGEKEWQWPCSGWRLCLYSHVSKSLSITLISLFGSTCVHPSRELVFLAAEVTVGFMMAVMAAVSSVTQVRPSPSACSRQSADGSHRDPEVSHWNLQISHCNWRSSAWWIFHWKKMI